MASVPGAPITCSLYSSHIGLNTEQADHHAGVRVYLVGYISAERHNAIQPTIIHNLFFLHGNQSLGTLSDPQSLSLPSTALPRGDRSRLHREQRPWFTTDPIGLAAFLLSLALSCISRLEVPPPPRTLDVATVCLAPILRVLTTLQQCVQVGMCRRWDDDNGLGHRSPQQQAAHTSRHSAALGGGWTARCGGLTTIICVRQAVPGYHGTQRCT
jgi:hypothetical protein